MTNGFFADKNRPLVLGHRGVPLAHQENTLAGFRKAIELGVDGIELDVFKTRDDRIVVFHDEQTERLTGVAGSIAEMTWDEVSQLRIQRRIDRGDGTVVEYPSEERIPLLEEVLDECGDSLLINIEMKAYAPNWSRRHTGTEVARVIKASGKQDNVISTSFDFFMLRKLEKALPGIHSGFAYDGGMLEGMGDWLDTLLNALPELDTELSRRAGNQNALNLLNLLLEANAIGRFVHSTVVDAEHTLIDSDTVQKFHQRNMLVGAYTLFPLDTRYVDNPDVDHEQEAHRLAALGVDWIETDDPERLLALLALLT
ncbi:hypothetical protein GCM10023116_44900 [Kistimonas scapharcae]|uniref:GP-PDE domain-containing protein n=1 Tax=Kistimonas scapharcae TaxID=1036133 RepID=A0ABP8VA01_9GAMM